jgi:phosphomannomutase
MFLPGPQPRMRFAFSGSPLGFPQMQLSPTIFKAYDIRGIVPSTLNEQVAEALGRAFGTVARRAGEATVAVGRDGRLSGPGMSAALVRGLVAAGVDVIDVGMVTTPML